MSSWNRSYSLSTRLRLMSDRISSQILYSDLPWIDIRLENERMREQVESEMPERLPYFERIYEARFERLWQQWRRENDAVCGEF